MTNIKLKMKLSSDARQPEYKTEGAAGFDLEANFNIDPLIIKGATFSITNKYLRIAPGGRVLIKTGIQVEVPTGMELQIRPRSGLSLNYDLLLANSPGTIDCDYRGDIGIILVNYGNDIILIEHQMRVAQAVLSPFIRADIEVAEELTDTKRGAGGFGHTGVK